jgi:hypothetical protein
MKLGENDGDFDPNSQVTESSIATPTPRYIAAPSVPKSPVFRVAVTGGPAAGKSTALPLVKRLIEAAGFHCMITTEVATRLLESCGGYDPAWAGQPEHIEMQCAFLDAQIFEEEVMAQMAKLRHGPTILIFDRGAVDGIAFCSDEQWAAVLKHGRTSVPALLQRYDLVVDMQTVAAFGDGSKYEWGPECISNKARFHNPAEARESALEITAAYAEHPHYCAVAASNDFCAKVDSLFDSIMAAAPMPCAGGAPVTTPASSLAPAPAAMAHERTLVPPPVKTSF